MMRVGMRRVPLFREPIDAERHCGCDCKASACARAVLYRGLIRVLIRGVMSVFVAGRSRVVNRKRQRVLTSQLYTGDSSG